jgi:hypothetical protein
MRTQHNWLLADRLALARAAAVPAVTMAAAGRLLPTLTRRSG